MTAKQIGLNETTYQRFIKFQGELVVEKRCHVTASDAVNILLDNYKPPAGAMK